MLDMNGEEWNPRTYLSLVSALRVIVVITHAPSHILSVPSSSLREKDTVIDAVVASP